MKFHRRIHNVEKLLPAVKQVNEKELEQVVEWLVQNSEKFRECVRQLFRLQYKSGQHTDNWEQWQEPYKEQAGVYTNCINELIGQHMGRVST